MREATIIHPHLANTTGSAIHLTDGPTLMSGTTTLVSTSTCTMSMAVGRDLALAVPGGSVNAATHLRSEKIIMPMNIQTDGTLVIKETSDDFFGLLLPVCTTAILSKILDPNVPWISLVGLRSQVACNWIEQHLPPLLDPSRRVESVQVKRLEMDVSLPTGEFLRLLPSFSGRGVDLVQAARPLPPRLYIAELKPESKAHVFREVGIVLQFYLPHPHENALVTSASREVLERVVAAFRR